jgi:uncharacterized protein
MEDIIQFIILALLAEILGTVGGFGSSIIFIPLASLFFDFYSVLGITSVFHVASNLSKIYLFKEGVDWKIVRNIGIPAVIFVSIGAFATRFVNILYVEIFLGIFLVVISLLFLIFDELKFKPNISNSIIGGSISGFLAGIMGTGGAIRGITLASFGLQKSVFIATSAFIDLGVDLSRGFVYFSNGYIHKHDLIYILLLIGVGFVGSYIGKRLLQYISEAYFKKIVLYLILIIGLFLILKLML